MYCRPGSSLARGIRRAHGEEGGSRRAWQKLLAQGKWKDDVNREEAAHRGRRGPLPGPSNKTIKGAKTALILPSLCLRRASTLLPLDHTSSQPSLKTGGTSFSPPTQRLTRDTTRLQKTGKDKVGRQERLLLHSGHIDAPSLRLAGS